MARAKVIVDVLKGVIGARIATRKISASDIFSDAELEELEVYESMPLETVEVLINEVKTDLLKDEWKHNLLVDEKKFSRITIEELRRETLDCLGYELEST